MSRTFELVVKDTGQPTTLVELKIDISIHAYLSKYAFTSRSCSN